MLNILLGKTEEKPLNIKQIRNINEETARQYFQHLRWGGLDEQICPKCGKKHKAYYKKTRKQWQCKHCLHTFSLASDTIFYSSKLSILDIFYLLTYYINSKNSVSTAQMSMNTGITYKNVFYNIKKIKYAFMREQENIVLEDKVHIDGKYKSSKQRKSNIQYNNKHLNTKENLLKDNPNKRVIINASGKHKKVKMKRLRNPLCIFPKRKMKNRFILF